MNRLFVAAIAAIVLLAMGCYSAPVMPPTGLIFMNVEAPVSPAVAGQPMGARTGRASASSILGLFAWGDASVAAAVRNGGIVEPQHIDYEFFNILLIYQKFTTVVHGE